MALIKLKTYGKAIEKAKAALELNSTNIKAFYRLSLASSNDGQFELAIRTAKQGLKVSPGSKQLEKLMR